MPEKTNLQNITYINNSFKPIIIQLDMKQIMTVSLTLTYLILKNFRTGPRKHSCMASTIITSQN